MGLTEKAKEINWRFKYVPQGQMEPDNRGRWMVIGSIKVPAALLPHYKAVGELLSNGLIPVDMVHISYSNPLVRDHDGYRFEAEMYFIERANHGLEPMFHAQTLEQAQATAQYKLHHLVACLCHATPTAPKQTVFSCLKNAGSIIWANINTLLLRITGRFIPGA